jgi:hypothetical protein
VILSCLWLSEELLAAGGSEEVQGRTRHLQHVECLPRAKSCPPSRQFMPGLQSRRPSLAFLIMPLPRRLIKLAEISRKFGIFPNFLRLMVQIIRSK